MNSQLCFKSLYESCRCPLNTHLYEDLPIIDSHCHLDDFTGKYTYFQSVAASNIRKVFLISNKHKFHQWDRIFPCSFENISIFETFGIHPKFIPERDIRMKLSHLESIFKISSNSKSKRPIIAVGETGLDDTSKSSVDIQKFTFEQQVLIARNHHLPLILHCRGYSNYNMMLDTLESILPKSHPLHWHCIKSDTNLQVIDWFISTFPNSIISFNGASTHIKDIDQDKVFKKWIRNHSKLLSHLALETDCPWLCPKNLTVHEFNPCTGIFVASKWLEDVLRARGKNASAIIRIANTNTKRIYNLPIEKFI